MEDLFDSLCYSSFVFVLVQYPWEFLSVIYFKLLIRNQSLISNTRQESIIFEKKVFFDKLERYIY